MVKSRLGRSLLRLECTLAQSRQSEQQADIVLAQWREQWLGNRDQISQRLELIETQLDQLTGKADSNRPQLSLVGVIADS